MNSTIYIFNNRWANLLSIFLILTLSGCGAGRTMVMEPKNKKMYVDSVEVIESESTVTVPEEAKEKFHKFLEKSLYVRDEEEYDGLDSYGSKPSPGTKDWLPPSHQPLEKDESEREESGPFLRGPGLKIKYRFIQFNPGSQFTRYMFGGIGNAGEGSLTVQAKFYDTDENEISRIQTEGKISSGLFGGSFDGAIWFAAKEIAIFTVQNFKAGGNGYPVSLMEKAPYTPSCDLAASYLIDSSNVEWVTAVKKSIVDSVKITFDGKDQKIMKSNAGEFETLLNDRLETYSRVIADRGYQHIRGEYSTEVPSGCKKLGFSDGKTIIYQNDFHLKLAHGYTDGSPKCTGVIVKSDIYIEHSKDIITSFRGKIAEDKIMLEHMPSKCTITLVPK